MNCNEFENLVTAIARDEVMEANAQRQGLGHAETCSRCARRLASERLLTEAMAAATAEDDGKRAPARVGKMLLDGFREQKRAGQRRRRSWIVRGVTGAVAASLLIGSMLMLRKSTEVPPVRDEASAVMDDDATAATGADEVTTDFIPLSYDPAPAGLTSVVRVELPRTALSAFGLPVNEDRMEDLVQADLLLDENGLTRAVRFVE